MPNYEKIEKEICHGAESYGLLIEKESMSRPGDDFRFFVTDPIIGPNTLQVYKITGEDAIRYFTVMQLDNDFNSIYYNLLKKEKDYFKKEMLKRTYVDDVKLFGIDYKKGIFIITIGDELLLEDFSENEFVKRCGRFTFLQAAVLDWCETFIHSK